MAFQTIRFVHNRYAIMEITNIYAILYVLKVITIDLNNAFTNKNNV